MTDASNSGSGCQKPFSRQEMDKIRQAAKDERTVREKFWESLKRLARNLPFTEDLVAAFYCATDAKTDMMVKATLFGALAYFVLPIDLIPDVAPIIGFTDDAAVLALAIKAISGSLTQEHRDKARETLKP